MEAVLGFTDYMKILIVAIFIYVLIYAILKKVALISDEKINAVLALLAAVIVSFSGVVTYAVSYAFNLFAIILIIMFVIVFLLMFLGVKLDEIGKMVNMKVVAGVLILIFLVVFAKSFFALNNEFEDGKTNSTLDVNTSTNYGAEIDIPEEKFLNVSDDTWAMFLFFLVLGIFVILIGK